MTAGFFLWKAMEEGKNTVDALADALTAEYEVEREVAVKDIRGFVEYLASLGVLQA